MIGGAGDLFLRTVPPLLRAGVKSGQMCVFGSVIRNAANGQIAGFLQEAAPLAQLLGNPASAVLAVADFGLDVAKLAQGEVIRAGVARIEEGMKTLASLGVSNLALTGANLGVSVVGFAVIAAQIHNLKRSVDRISGQIGSVSLKIDQLQRDAIDADFVEAEALSRAYEEGWRLSDQGAEGRWRNVAESALGLQVRFEMRAGRILADGVEQYVVADPFLDALSLANGLRVAALSACNEGTAAQLASADGARSLERLTGGIGLADLTRPETRKMVSAAGTTRWALAQAEANLTARDTVQRIRLREAFAATRAAQLAELHRRGVSPRKALAEAREETESPMLFLASTGS